jgi:hypothetical protein
MNKQMRSGVRRSEGVVLGGDLVVVEVADEGDLLEDVGLDAGDAVEEEEGEDAGRDAEGGADGAPVCAHVLLVRCFPGGVAGCLSSGCS